jgi:hypothetical protein
MARALADDGHDVVLATTSTLDPAAIESTYRLTALPPGDDVGFSLPQPAATA